MLTRWHWRGRAAYRRAGVLVAMLLLPAGCVPMLSEPVSVPGGIAAPLPDTAPEVALARDYVSLLAQARIANSHHLLRRSRYTPVSARTTGENSSSTSSDTHTYEMP